ncbi:hypothetical protein IV38_GL000991 [Lactobacillus selangorensis]|uniref:Acetyl-CoA carboxylase n=1 Tax=Lactobacillus selangorensis TaxID=81857 RepID=A0A0R2FJE3_9LACO|nr:acetyl-CoA carboxylase [Lactobacillus selangorensis]KRN28786.1 hypothetical protein IV38_GL000991 [Lactobacillus selangorensis]KRN32804.1 hypothetical protein IV40_GL000862 [Lactobacillus selangorensis]
MNNDLKLIEQRIDEQFQRKSRTMYWLEVVDDVYDQTYNFFMCHQKKGEPLRSVPLHSLTDHDLASLETIIAALQHYTQLTIHYFGFVGQEWPGSHRIIQKKRHGEE